MKFVSSTVRIISAEKPTYWYANKIGQEFEVFKEYKNYYLLGNYHKIEKSDCIVITPCELPDDLFEL